jgi:hypothetical protein
MEEVDIEKAKTILGDIVKQMTDDQLKDTCVEMQYLVETWLDDYERSIFGGKTLRELLGESV